MKVTIGICWLLIAVCVCFSEAKNKIRRPLSSPYISTLMLKNPRPINHRISMGNTIHIGGSLSHQRVPYKHANYRIHRPMMYNVLSTSWKNQIPIRAPLSNRAILPQRVSTKEIYSINKMPEYNSEYRPELAVLPPIHRRDIDDDKGPIHTIPAPNLSLADKPYSTTNSKEIASHYSYPSHFNYHTTAQEPVTNTFGLAAVNNSLLPQGVVTNSTPSQHRYEVTENNDITLKERQIVQPATFQPQNLDVTKLYSIVINNPHLQSNELFANHPVNVDKSAVEPKIQFDQSSVPVQTNLQGSLHMELPSAVVQTPYIIEQQIPTDLYVGHPTPAESPLSVMQLYNLLDNFPRKLTERYTSDQQHILRQQLGQIFQPDVVTSFSQPQMHSFNYDEQANQLLQQQQQQQQILSKQNYVSESVTANYNLDPKSSVDIHKQNDDVRINVEYTYPTDGIEQSENNIESEETIVRRENLKIPENFDALANDNNAISKFYTTLPNREAAEKLAALAAAGNVNSRLIGQLQKQQEKDAQKNDSMPFNHKNNDEVIVNQQQVDGNQQQQRYNQLKLNKSQQEHNRKHIYKMENDTKLPLQITVSDEDDYIINNDNQPSNMEYEYETEDEEIADTQSAFLFDAKTTSSRDNDSYNKFGSRLQS